ncbi:MAG: VOC family protein [Bacteroidales bacterium]|nr:VOC family protein [Bacteroidales bacterium]
MEIKFHSTVIITEEFEQMKSFYQNILQQNIEFDFGNCIGFTNGLSLWQLKEEYPIAKKLGRTFDKTGNNNLEICFETDEFELAIENLKKHQIKYLHEETEELWGQRTVRFYDPENNLVEIGETIPCFVKRFQNEGMNVAEISKKTSVPIEMVKEICQPK